MIVHGVIHEPPGTPGAHEAHAAQQPELVRCRRLADSDKRRNVAHAQLSVLEGIQNADSRRVTKNTERVRERLDGARFQEASPAGSSLTGGEMEAVARIDLSCPMVG
jgi:hypothetical protein